MASDSEWSPLTAADTPTIDVTATTLTRHQTLLGTNEPPEGAELTFIRSVMSETGVRLTYLDDEITRLRERLRQLEEERTSLASYHAQNTAILSPVRRMPAELLEEIFLWTLPSTDDARYRRIFDAKSSPWVLTHICSRWREVALSTSSLWSLVVIHCNWMAANPLAMVKTQIQRARTLRIHFYGRERTTDSRPEIKMFRLLAEQSSRWTELRLELTSQLLPLLVSLRRRLPSLRRLWIQSVSTSQTSVGSIDCFQAAPCLVDATIRNYGHSHAHILLPAQHLTRYDLSGTWEMHRDILKLAQNLVEARIIIFDEPSGEVIDVPLQRLYTRTADVFDFIRAPALSEITIYVDGDDDHDLPHLDLLVARSGCTLRRLSFEGLPTAHIATHVLPKHPSITELAIVINEWARYDATNALISHLTIPTPTATAAFSPQLSAIYVGCHDVGCIDYALYLKMLRSRWKADGCALESAALLMDGWVASDAATLSGLDQLRQDGLNLLLLEGKEASDFMEDLVYLRRWT